VEFKPRATRFHGNVESELWGLDGTGRQKYGSRDLKIGYNKINDKPLFYNSQTKPY
jgi:hypothetical protein